MKKFIAIAILSSVVAMPALAENFTRDGVSYSYEVKQSGSTSLISGRNLSTGESFKLRVNGTRVAGQYDGQKVAFPIPATTASTATTTTLAAN
jgi:hypothetical protein